MSATTVVSIASALVALALVAMVLTESRRYARDVPAVVWVMCGYLVVQVVLSLNRVVETHVLPEFTTGSRAAVLDGVGTVLLLILLLNARRIGRMAQRTLNDAQYRAGEYERARRDYTQVVRHRVMNPLTVILGGVETLRAGAIDDPELARRLLGAIEDSARMIEAETLMPERRDALERDLDAIPDVGA